MDQTCFKLLLVMAHTFVVYGQYCVNTTAYSMTNTNAMTIDLSSFANCTSATYVNVSNNQIAKLENETFYYIWSIRILDLSFNNLTEIGSDTLSNLGQLEGLYITNNNLRTLPMDFFVNKLNLITVDLSYNRIYEIPLPVFEQELPAIKEVILQHNELTAYEPWALAYEKEYQVIRYIDLRYNNIYKFTNDYNWSYPGRHVLDWSLTDVRFNNLTHMEIDYYQQYKSKSGHDAVSTIMAEVLVDVRNNSIICDCFLYWIAQSVHESFFKWTNNDLLKIYCQEPPELQNKLALYEVRLSEFICNVTLNCPAGCLCQERPEARVIHVDCNNRSLANIPDILPSNTDYSAYELIVNNNQITRIENVSYSPQLSVFDASNNLISYISKEFIEKIAEKDEVRINLRNNHLTSVTDAMENIKYQNVDLSGNNLVCDCSMLWMKNWINLAPKYTDKNLNCTFENEIYRVVDLNEHILNCSNIGNIILIVFLSVGLVIVIALIVTAKRCPYATKVLIFKIFRIHPADRYIVDTVPDENYEYDAYIAYDEDDTYVRKWVERVLHKKLEVQKPHYKLFIGARDKKSGPEADRRVEAMENSRRLIIILSEKFNKKQWCDYDACQAETLEYNHGRVMFILYDKKGEAMTLQEPWLSKTKDRKVFHLNERMFWSKIRYEMPRKSIR